jgi:hypothetical protein
MSPNWLEHEEQVFFGIVMLCSSQKAKKPWVSKVWSRVTSTRHVPQGCIASYISGMTAEKVEFTHARAGI